MKYTLYLLIVLLNIFIGCRKECDIINEISCSDKINYFKGSWIGLITAKTFVNDQLKHEEELIGNIEFSIDSIKKNNLVYEAIWNFNCDSSVLTITFEIAGRIKSWSYATKIIGPKYLEYSGWEDEFVTANSDTVKSFSIYQLGKN